MTVTDVEDKAAGPEAVAEIFAKIFEVPAVEPDDDFFALGGDSLMAESLMTAIEERFGAILSISALLEGSTPRLLAAAANARLSRKANPSLHPVRAEGRGSPLYCVHGMDGYSKFPRTIAETLSERPIYSLRAFGLLEGEFPLSSIPQMAAAYLNEVKLVQSAGPYLIFGQCGASLIAFEMAQQLRKSGDEVAGLILADPLHSDLRYGGELIPWVGSSGMALSLIQARSARKAEQLVQEAREKPPSTGAERRELAVQVVRAALAAYAPQPYPGATLLISASERVAETFDPLRGMPRFAQNAQRLTIGKTHASVFQKHAPATVAAVAKFLDEVAPL